MNRLHDDTGSSLVLALAFVLAIGLAAAGLLGFVHAGNAATAAVTDQGRDLYAAEIGIQRAIGQLRLDKTLGAVGSCGPFTTTANGRSVTVTCTPMQLPTGGASREVYNGGGPGAVGLPAGALVGLGTEGISIRNNSSPAQTLRIGGPVLANGPVSVLGGPVATLGDVRAPSCSVGPGASLLTDTSAPRTCVTAVATPATDPSFVRAAPTTQPSDAPVLPATCSGLTFPWSVPSGTYRNASALSAFVNSCPETAELRFAGVYHLAFEDMAATACGVRAWCIQRAGMLLSAGTLTAHVPPTCSADGALFVLSGESRIDLRAGTLRMCGLTGSDEAQVLLYAKSPPPLPAGSPTSHTITLSPASVTSHGNPSYSPVTNARAIDGTTAAATDGHNGNSEQTKTATASGTASTTAVPAGATITSVRARVAHAETTTGTATISRTLTLGGTVSATRDVPAATSLTTHEFVVTSLLSTPALVNGATLSYAVTGVMPKDSGFTSTVDGMDLVVSYTLPAVPVVPWGTLTCGSPPCTVLSVDGSNSNITLGGTLYAPTSRVDIHAVNAATTAATRGIVARQISVQVPTLQNFNSFHLAIPGGLGGTLRRDGLVTLTATVGTDPTVRARATVQLPEGATPTGAVVSGWNAR